jgi:hypothetical protein
MILLRAVCALAGLGWLTCLAGLVTDAETAYQMLRGMGGELVPHPMLTYWMRMAAVVFCGLGVVFLLGAAGALPRWQILSLGWFHLAYGAYLGCLALDGPRGWAVLLDVGFCIGTGLAIVLLVRGRPGVSAGRSADTGSEPGG